MADQAPEPTMDEAPDAKKGKGSLLVGVLLIALLVGAFLFFRPPSLAGDRAKLDASLTATQQQQAESRTVAPAELEAADGKDGRPAWISVSGVVFDVSASQGWKDGEHRGVKAGTDGTELFVQSPHGFDTLSRTPVVGRLAG